MSFWPIYLANLVFFLAYVSSLLGLPHRLGLYFHNLDANLVHSASGQSISSMCLFGQASMHWNRQSAFHSTTIELRRPHRRFGNPSMDKLYCLLERADVDSVVDLGVPNRGRKTQEERKHLSQIGVVDLDRNSAIQRGLSLARSPSVYLLGLSLR